MDESPPITQHLPEDSNTNANEDDCSPSGVPISVKEEGRGIYHICPVLAWEKVLTYLEPKDKYILFHVSRDFENLLKPTAFTWLFEKIIPVVESYLPTNDLRKCRRICRTWATAINELFYDKIQENPKNIRFLIPFRLEFNRDPRKDLEHLHSLAQDRDYLKSSVVGKFVELFDDGQFTVGDNLRTVLPVLRNAWHFQLHNFNSHIDCYKVLRESVPYLVHTRSLVIWNLFPRPSLRQIRAIQDYVRENPLPESGLLPKLESVEVCSSHRSTYENDIVDPIHQALVTTYSTQIRILKIPMCQMHNDLLRPLINLKELHLQHVTGKRMAEFAALFNETENLSLTKLKIESQKGDIYFMIEQFFWELRAETILKSISHLPLEHLDIKSPEDANWGFSGGVGPLLDTLRMEHLTYLKIEDFWAMSFDILLCMPKLKEIHIFSYIWPSCKCSDCRRRRKAFSGSYAGGGLGDDNSLNMRRYLHNGQMYESNVWDKLEKLERLSVEIDHPDRCEMFNYTRLGYKRHQIWERTTEVLEVADDDDDDNWQDID